MNAVYELAKTIQGHPVALSVAASNIYKNLRDLPSKIWNYITKLKPDEPQGGAGRSLLGKISGTALVLGASKNMKCVTNNVFDTTINLIEDLPQGTEALDLLKLMVYLPPNEISIEIMEKISRMCLGKDFDEDGFDILQKHSLISIHEEEKEEEEKAVDSSFSSKGRANKGRRIVIQQMLRLYCIRKLDEECNPSYMLRICRFYDNPHVSKNHKNKQAMISLHQLLKKRNWPNRSIYFSIVLCSYLITDKNYFQYDVSQNWQRLRDSVHHRNGSIATMVIAQDIFSFLDDRDYRDINMKGIINLYLSCLFWLDQKEIPRWDADGGDGDEPGPEVDGKKKNSAVKRKHLESIFLSLVKPTIMDLLAPKKDSMSVLKLCYQFCFNSLHTFELNDESTSLHNEIDEVIFSTVNTAKDCSLRKIGQLYDLLWKFGFHGTGKSFVKCLKTVLKKHFEVYPKIMRLRYDCDNSDLVYVDLLLHNYWVDGGPLRFNKFIKHCDCNESYEDYTIDDYYGYTYEELKEEDEINTKFIETFFTKKGIQVITDYLQFMCRENFSTTHAYLFQFIDIMAFEAHGANNFLKNEAFMKAFYNFTLKFKNNPKKFLGLQIQCATSWFGLFAKRNVQPIRRDGDGAGEVYQFSIHDVAKQLANMLRFIKPITTGNFGFCFRALCKKTVYTSFLETYRDEPPCLAVETAQCFLALCLDEEE